MNNRKFNNAIVFEEEKDYRFKLLKKIVDLLLTASLLLSLFFLVTGGTFALFDSLFSFLLMVIIRLSLKRENYLFSALFLMISLLVADNLLIYLGDGIHDITIMLIPLTILISSLLLKSAYYWLYISLLILTIAVQGVLELTRVITNNLSPYTWELDPLILTVFFILLAFIVRYFTDGLYKALNEAYLNAQDYRNIFQSTADGIMIHNPVDGSLIDSNDSARRILGYSPEEMQTLQLSHLCSNEPGYSLSELLDWFRKAETEGPLFFKWLAMRKDGTRFWLEISLNEKYFNGRKRVISVIRDIDEVTNLEAELLQSEKLKALGQLAGGIAHDFNNQLMVIRGLFEIINQETDNRSHKKYLEMINKSIIRSVELVNKMLSFARKGASSERPVVLQDLIKETVYMLKRSIDKRIILKTDFSRTPLTVWGDPNQLQNVILNMGINAIDAISKKGEILFSCSIEERPGASSEEGQAVPSACLTIKDNGVGIPPEIQDKIFDPFFSTKKEGSGTGLGLSAAYGTIRQHNGDIQVTSGPGGGTEFRIFLPLYQPKN